MLDGLTSLCGWAMLRFAANAAINAVKQRKYDLDQGRRERGACSPSSSENILLITRLAIANKKLCKNTPVFCLFLKSTCTFVSSFWGVRLQTSTDALPLNPAGDFRPPDLMLVPPLANSWLRPWSRWDMACCASDLISWPRSLYVVHINELFLSLCIIAGLRCNITEN